MDKLLYWLARGGVALLQALPLPWVARLGRAVGALAYCLDARHRGVALGNLTMCFGNEKSPAEIRAIARENFRRIGENFAGAIKTFGMTPEQMRPHFNPIGAEKILPRQDKAGPQSRVVAIGHFGNFELYARFNQFVPGFQCATTYRSLRQPALDRLMQSLRANSHCRFFERRTEAAALKAAIVHDDLLLGLLADQHAGGGGVRLPFLGHECGTSPAVALFAMRYRAPLHVAVCYHIGLARWQIEVSDEIPLVAAGEPRSNAAIMTDVNRVFENAVRRDPANWFWVHNRWKPEEAKSRRRAAAHLRRAAIR
ncbi:MAG: hypothetical protein NTZ16_06820 [Verrucomicrobia bacterium]|nr:hypothetical protein [Verrucomicrobiota bacterium]